MYDWALSTTATEMIATLKGIQASPRAKALAEGVLGALAITVQGADLVAGPGLAQATSATYGLGDSSWEAFAAFSGGSSRYDTGSNVDMSSLSLLTGLAKGLDTAPGRLTFGAFFEYGNGSYDTHNSFANAAAVNGDGDADYFGGGLLGRLDFAESDSGRFYAEASARMGRVDNDYSTSDLRDASGRSAGGFDASSAYYGAHLGAGYVWNLSDKTSLDLYGKYFWTRQQGDSVTLATGDPVTFEDADSHRLRGGVRLSWAASDSVTPYIGAAYEHEFDGRALASTYGYAIDAPELKGGTGIGEIGINFKPAAASPLSFDLGLQGYTGTREGVTGSLQLRFEF